MEFIRSWFAHPAALALFAVVPLLGLVGLISWRLRRRALRDLGNGAAMLPLLRTRKGIRFVRAFAWMVGVSLLIVAVAGPQWGREIDPNVVTGRDIVIVLDASRSMAAEDVLGKSAPNRFGRARDALFDLVDAVEKTGGHRLALVAFAAKSRIVCPLTRDYDHFLYVLGKLDQTDLLRDLGPGPDSPSGTRMGEALATAVETAAADAPDSRFRGRQDILMISDGDDPARDDEWRRGIAEARPHGLRIHTVGVGDPDHDCRIPFKDGFLQHQGQEVKTRLYEGPLQEIARQTGGVYTPARTRDLPLGQLFRDTIEPLADRQTPEDLLPSVRQRYAWFFAAALIALAASFYLSEARAFDSVKRLENS